MATETPAPEDDPPGIRGSPGSPTALPKRPSQAAGVGKCGLVPTPENANSTMWVRPIMAPPAAFRRATAGLSDCAGAEPARTCDPARVGCPATSNRSLTENGSPASRDIGAGAWLASAWRATSRASSNCVCRKAGQHAADCACSMACPIAAEAVRSPSWMRCRVARRSTGMSWRGRPCYNLQVLQSQIDDSVKTNRKPVPQGVATSLSCDGSVTEVAISGLDFRLNLWSRNHVRYHARNAGSRCPFRSPDPLLESQDGALHLWPPQQDPHHQPGKIACRCSRKLPSLPSNSRLTAAPS